MDTNQTIISTTVRKRTPSSKDLKLVFNFGKDHVKQLSLATHKFVQISKVPGTDNKFDFKFYDQDAEDRMKVTYSPPSETKATPSATIYTEPENFGIAVNEPIDKTQLKAEYTPNGIVVEFNKEELFKTRIQPSEQKTIASPEDKLVLAFPVDSAWGVKITYDLDDDVKTAIRKSIQANIEASDVIDN